MRFIFQPFYNGYILIKQSYYMMSYGFWIAAIIFIMYLGAPLAVFLWWRKQTLRRAWLLAFSAMVAGPGLAYMFPARFNFNIYDGLKGFLCLNLFYFILVLLSACQKEFWPENKFANSIRAILAKACLRV